MLAWSQGARINECVPQPLIPARSQNTKLPNRLGHNDLALSSGPYSYGYANAFGHVPRMSISSASAPNAPSLTMGRGPYIAGDYTLVVSAFEPHHIGKFSLKLECSDRFDLTPILQEGAGMFSKVIRDEWCAVPPSLPPIGISLQSRS